MRITLLSRPGCHLCEEALKELNDHLAREADRAGSGISGDVRVDVVDIESDDSLHRRYLELIPVILLDDEVVSELAFSSEEFDAAIARRLQGRG